MLTLLAVWEEMEKKERKIGLARRREFCLTNKEKVRPNKSARVGGSREAMNWTFRVRRRCRRRRRGGDGNGAESMSGSLVVSDNNGQRTHTYTYTYMATLRQRWTGQSGRGENEIGNMSVENGGAKIGRETTNKKGTESVRECEWTSEPSHWMQPVIFHSQLFTLHQFWTDGIFHCSPFSLPSALPLTHSRFFILVSLPHSHRSSHSPSASQWYSFSRSYLLSSPHGALVAIVSREYILSESCDCLSVYEGKK